MEMRMDFPRLVFFAYTILIPHLVAVTVAQPDLVYHNCSENVGTYSNNSTYQSNLNTLLSTLFSYTEINYGFYNFSVGQSPNKVNAIALCRGDITQDKCHSCLNDSRLQLPQRCPYQNEAIGGYDECMLRYSNRSIFGTLEILPSFYVPNPNNVSSEDVFNQALKTLLDSLQSKAASGNSLLKFATGEATGTGDKRIYGFMQCTPDLNESSCSSCLEGAINDVPACCGNKEGGRIFKPSCSLRFETFRFYDFTAANTPPPATWPPSSPSPSDNLTPPSPAIVTPTKGKKSNTPRTLILIVVPSVIISVLFIIFICFFLKKRPRGRFLSFEGETRTLESLQFQFSTIRFATDNFSDANKLGEGGFGSVYKGRLSDGQEIAVKRLSAGSKQGELEFKNEVLLMAKLQHRNLVRLLGFCLERSERLLIYEFMPNLSLHGFIFDPIKQTQLNWEKRYKIIGGIARGLLYLHEDSRLRIIHRDLKASNILLDAEMNPKISDFGIARLFAVDQTQENTSRIMGTYGYMAPEYVLHGKFSVKSDVYSLGVLILEIISGQKNNCFHVGENTEYLLTHAWISWREGTASSMIDPTLRDGSTSEIMRCIHIGLLCAQENVADRPTMASVMLMLSSYSLSLPIPSHPAFFLRSNIDQNNSSGQEHNSRLTDSDLSRSSSPINSQYIRLG
ncbi:hypothetical protein PVL29_012656 [Vitis rotundifolia]|uniref:Cysteine-rich receptor-like protein kinase 29 n=2 Tax=Vitis rotundifolia TaxID=103349 RepID=A0AA39DNN4_VITRO|nr:hypothetical protein PVL29_012656 [Vitis rotundifolia]